MKKFNPKTTTVFTIPERVMLYKETLGGNLDVQYENDGILTFADKLENVSKSGGKTVVIDTDYFVHLQDLRRNLKLWCDELAFKRRNVRICVLCFSPWADKQFVRFLIQYCMIFDVICYEDINKWQKLLFETLEKPRTRKNVLSLMSEFDNEEMKGNAYEKECYVHTGTAYIKEKRLNNILDNPTVEYATIKVTNEYLDIRLKVC